MANIPTIPGYTFVDTPSGGQRMDLSAATARGRGIEAIGSAVQGVSQVLADFAIKKQHALDIKGMAEADLEMSKAQQAFNADVAANKYAPEDVPQEWQNRVDRVKQNLAQKNNMSPMGRRNLDNAFQMWSVNTTGHYTTQANKMIFEDGKAAVLAAATESARNGELDAAIQKLTIGKQGGFFHDKDYTRAVEAVKNQSSVAQFEQLMGASPYAALTAIDEKNPDGTYKNFQYLKPNERMAYRERAIKADAHELAQGVADVRQNQDDGRIYTKEELDQLVDAHQIPQGHVATLLKRQKAPMTEEELGGAVNDLYQWVDKNVPAEIANKDEALLKVNEMLIHNGKSSGVPEGIINNLKQMILERVPKPNKVGLGNPSGQAMSIFKSAADTGLWGFDDGTYKTKASIAMKRAKAETMLREWHSQHPNATPSDLAAQAIEIVKAPKEQAGARHINQVLGMPVEPDPVDE